MLGEQIDMDYDTFKKGMEKRQLKLTEEDIKSFNAGEPITYEPRMPLQAPTEARGEFLEGGSWGSSSKEQNA